MFIRILFSAFLFLFIISCSTQDEKEIDDKEVTDNDIISCSNSTTLITENDSIAIASTTNPIVWKGSYTKNTVKIDFTKNVGSDNETERISFVFNKVNNCLKISYAYKYYDGKQVDVSAITGLEYLESFTQDWEIDKKFTGVVKYSDPHNGQIYTRKFWVTLTVDDYVEEDATIHLFSNCFSAKLPIAIDLNKDGKTDFNLNYETIRNVGNNPKYSEFTIKLISTNNDINKILSPKRNTSPYFVIFETPFTSENTKQYFNGVKNTLDVFYEFDKPYQQYNYFLNNNLTYKDILSNNLDDYYVISMIINGNEYFGWIKFKFNANSCSVEVLDTFLNPNPNEAISVN